MYRLYVYGESVSVLLLCSRRVIGYSNTQAYVSIMLPSSLYRLSRTVLLLKHKHVEFVLVYRRALINY